MTDNHNRVNDNADNGKRGSRAVPSVNLINMVTDLYGLKDLELNIDLGGSSSLNLLTINNDGRYVVRVYRPYVTEARLADINLVRHTLNSQGIPSSEVLSTRAGRPHFIFDNRLVEVEKYVESDAHMDTWEHMMVALPLLGRIHSILQPLRFSRDGRYPLFANYIEPQEVLSKTLLGTRRIRGWIQPTDNLKLTNAAEELAHLVTAGEKDSFPHLPRQMVHGDFWDNNVFFREGRVVLVNDFDFMGERARIDDLALILYYFDCSNKPMSDKRLTRLRWLVDAYDEGLDQRLSRTERAALPLAMARQPLWSIGGWIALLDDEEAAQRHASGMLPEVEWALGIVREMNRWQTAFI